MRLVQDYLPKELDVEESIVEGVFPSLMKAHFEFIIQRPPSIPIRPTTHHKENLVQRLQKLKHLTVTIEPRQCPTRLSQQMNGLITLLNQNFLFNFLIVRGPVIVPHLLTGVFGKLRASSDYYKRDRTRYLRTCCARVLIENGLKMATKCTQVT